MSDTDSSPGQTQDRDQATGDDISPNSVSGLDGPNGDPPAPPMHPDAAGAVPTGHLVALSGYYLLAIGLMHFHKLAGLGALGVGLLLFRRPLGTLLGAHLIGSWKIIDQEAEQERVHSKGFDLGPLTVLATAAVVLTLIKYFGMSSEFNRTIGRHLPDLGGHRYYQLYGLLYWSGFRVLAYIGVPWLTLRLMRGCRLLDCGLATRGFLSHLKIYGMLYLIVLPPLVMVSFTGPFLRTYPFYDQAARSWTDLLLWEAVYTVQFFALEVFFRGFMLHQLKRRFGSQAIFIMALPYCMIHFQKPLAEAAGAFLAAMVLGTLSLRTRSIWAGVLLHATAAISMDGLAVLHKAGYPGNPRFIG